MKKIKDIMKEMNSLSEQIAVSLSADDEEEVNEVETVTQTTPSCSSSETTCAHVDSNSRNVNFCAVINLPNNFVPTTSKPSPKIIYDLSCLKTVVESCCCNGIPKWSIRVIGSISFIVNVDIKNTQGVNCIFPCHNTVAACGSNSVCINRVICNKCNYEDAIISRSNIKLNCDTVTVKNLDASFNQNDCFVKVTGTFVLPTCS